MVATVANNPGASRYELLIDGQVAGIADYSVEGDVIVFPHTEIDAARRGKGLGAVLVRGALEDVRARGLKLTVECEFIAAYLKRHRRDWADLLPVQPD